MDGAGILNQPLNNSTDTTVALNNGNDAVTVGDIVQVDAEQMDVKTILSANNFTVTRARHGTTIAAHAIGALVRIGVSPANVLVTHWGKDGHGYWTKG